MKYLHTISNSVSVARLAGFAALFLFCGAPVPAFAAATSTTAAYNLTTDKTTFTIGSTFTVDVKIESPAVGINAGQATITFPKNTVQVTSIDKSASAFDFWLQGPSFSNETGQVSFIGGSQNGISGQALEVLRITFKVLGAGSVPIVFTDGAVTASDGSGTNILAAMNGLQLTSITTQSAALIAPPQITRAPTAATGLPAKPVVTVPLYADQSAWHANVTSFLAQWSLPSDVTAVAAVVNGQATSDPIASAGLFNHITFPPLSDGTWYVHVRFKNALGWGVTAHYRIQVDSTPPLGFTISSKDGLTTEDVAPTISFPTKDQPSGVREYRVLLDGALATTTTRTSYTLLPQQSGSQTLVVQAVDWAGNMTESRATLTVLAPPLITIAGMHISTTEFYVFWILALIAVGAVGWYLGFRERVRERRRILIAERDVHALLTATEKHLTNALKSLAREAPVEQVVEEVKSILEGARQNIKKSKPYVVQNVEEIQRERLLP